LSQGCSGSRHRQQFALTLLLAPPRAEIPQVMVTLPALASYDALFEVAP
jgi:hypothetical protein